jgi:sulfhydrogenase subunit beta (sulfur reductase)
MIKESTKTKLASLKHIYFDKETAQKFVSFLKTKAEVIAPHKKGESSFYYEKVNDANDVVFQYPRTIQSIKKYFFPPKETLLHFDTESNTYHKPEIKAGERIFFAVHSYEMQAIKCLDYSFANGNPESNYFKRREKAIFIGIDYIPDSWHFSKSVGIDIEELEGFSLFFYTTNDGYIVFEVDKEGKKLLKDFGLGKSLNGAPFEIEEREFKTKLRYHYNRIPRVFEHVYKSKVWDKWAERCLGCATCNLLCATCYCFDVKGEIELDVKNGYRERIWDGCMLNRFAEVAGGENFREKLLQRNRHRLYRKFKYITDKSGLMHCVGCGRCSRYCPAGISLPDIVNDLIDDYEEKQMIQTI